MSRDCLHSLCQHKIWSIGERQFKPELYIYDFLDKKGIMFNANVETTGGFILGEVKLNISIRLFDGGDALDLAAIFDIHSDHCTRIMHDVLLNWVIITGIGDLNINKHIDDKDEMEKVSRGFAKISNGVLKRALGTINSWRVCILRPTRIRDGVRNPTTFFSRKLFLVWISSVSLMI